MQHVSALPGWAQWGWAICGMLMLCLAICWTLFIFWPYLRRSERKHDESIRLAKESGVALNVTREELTSALQQLATAMGKLADSQKTLMAVTVVSSVVPVFLKAVFKIGEDAPGIEQTNGHEPRVRRKERVRK